MTAREFAEEISGGPYGAELTADEKHLAKENGFVVVFGASDDTMIFDGVLDNEVDCYGGGTFHISRNGIVWLHDATVCNDCQRFDAAKIRAVWHDNGNPCWTYETDIPHEEFTVRDDYEPQELYCIGIVFKLEDLPE